MKKTKTFLSPMSPSGEAGEEFGIQFEDEAPQYLEPYAENDALGKLRHKVHQAAAKLRAAKARGAKAAEITTLKAAYDAAKASMDAAHRGAQKAREQQQTGIDYGAPSPFSRDTRMFMEPVPYFTRNDYDGNDTTGRTFDDEADDELEAKILAAVEALEKAQSDGASWAEVLRLEAALKVLREHLPNPSAPPAATTAAAPRKEHITRPAPTQPTGQAAPAVKKNDRAGWDKFLRAFDARQAKRRKDTPLRPGGASSSAHSADVCCSGKYLCAKCQAKKAAVV